MPALAHFDRNGDIGVSHIPCEAVELRGRKIMLWRDGTALTAGFFDSRLLWLDKSLSDLELALVEPRLRIDLLAGESPLEVRFAPTLERVWHSYAHLHIAPENEQLELLDENRDQLAAWRSWPGNPQWHEPGESSPESIFIAPALYFLRLAGAAPFAPPGQLSRPSGLAERSGSTLLLG